jgi:hypothetical protein
MKRAIGHDREPILAPLGLQICSVESSDELRQCGEHERHNIAPLCHMREGPDGSPSRPRDPKPEV